MNKYFTSLTIAIASVSLSSHAIYAQANVPDFILSSNVGFVSQYSFRGIAQSNENIAVQGGFDVAHRSGFYAGLWGSNVNFNDSNEANIEVDVFAGFSSKFKGLNYDLGVIYYAYPGADSSLDYDFVEGAISVGYDFDTFSTSASINYSPEYFGESGDAFYYAGAIDVPLPKEFSLSAHVGYQQIDDNTAFGVPDYLDWSVGLGYTLSGFDLSLAYVDTDLKEPSECSDGCDARVIFGVSRSF